MAFFKCTIVKTDLPEEPSHRYMLGALETLLADLATADNKRAGTVANHIVTLLYNTAVHYFIYFERTNPLLIEVGWGDTDGEWDNEFEIVLAPGPRFSTSRAEAANGQVHVKFGDFGGFGRETPFDLAILQKTLAARQLGRFFQSWLGSAQGPDLFTGLHDTAGENRAPLSMAKLDPAPTENETGNAKLLVKKAGTEQIEPSRGDLALSLNMLVTPLTGNFYFPNTTLLVVVNGQLGRVQLDGLFVPGNQNPEGYRYSLLSADVAYGCLTRWWYMTKDQVRICTLEPAAVEHHPHDTLCAFSAGQPELSPAAPPLFNRPTKYPKLEFKPEDVYRVWATDGALQFGSAADGKYQYTTFAMVHDLRKDTRTSLQGTYKAELKGKRLTNLTLQSSGT